MFHIFTNGRKNLYIIDNSIVGTENGCMPANYGRYYSNGLANASDIIHLGKLGLRVFCKNIKNSIIGRSRSQSEQRFLGDQGNYRSAEGRSRRSDHSRR